MKKLLVSRLAAVLVAPTLLLAACGGGGGGDDGTLTPPSTFGASASFEGNPFEPASCSIERQKRFVRSYLDEVYLWYNEIPQVNAALYSDPIAYFDALTNIPKDKGFSAAIRTGFAREFLAQSFAPPQANHTPYVPVARVDADPTTGRRVAYIRFSDHAPGAQDDLITAFNQVRNAGAQDLILDMRDNSGGFLYIARTAASMIVGPAAEGRVFEQLLYNDKRPEMSGQPGSTFRFSSAVQEGESQYPTGTALPQLNLPRVYVLATEATCSSSESIVNGLRGIDVQVILVGSTTCGKPYGFHEKANCGVSYFPIEFRGANAKGFGDYVNGFAPTCPVTPSSDPAVQPGTVADPLYAAAQYHIVNGSCPPAAAQASAQPKVSLPQQQPSRPAWAGRLVQR